MKIELHFGALCASLKEQLKGLPVPDLMIGSWQKDADAITRLHLRGLLSDSEARKAHERLVKNITGTGAVREETL